MTESILPNNRPKMVRGRITESKRLSGKCPCSPKPQVIAYHRYVFTDTGNYLNEVSCFILLICESKAKISHLAIRFNFYSLKKRVKYIKY